MTPTRPSDSGITQQVDPPLDQFSLPSDVIAQFEEFPAPQPTLLTVYLDNVTAYCQDTVDLNPTPITNTNGSTTGGSTALTVSTGTGLAVGMGVSGAGIPAGATLASGSGTSWVLSIAATATASGVTLTFTNMRDPVDLVHLTQGAMASKVTLDNTTFDTTKCNMFPLEVVGDIVRINDDTTVKGLYLSKNSVTKSSPTAATGSGTMISDARMTGFRHDIFKILYPDPMVTGTTMAIGSITASGVSSQDVPPGGPLNPDGTPVIRGGDWSITGGTGAFLGATGQMGGQGSTGKGAIRTASITEDPSERRANAFPVALTLRRCI